MIWKIIALFFVLSIVGCSSSVINTTDSKSFAELQLAAHRSCIANYSIFLQQSMTSFNTYVGELACPLHCLISKLNIVNAGGLNKMLVNWTREEFTLEKLENYFGANFRQQFKVKSNSSEELKTGLDAVFHIIHTFNDHLEEACSATDKVTRNQQVNTWLTELKTVLRPALSFEPLENPSAYTPSGESSVYLQLARNAGEKCMSNFNVTVPSIISNANSRRMRNLNNICTVHCLVSELEFINKNGINLIWMDEYRKIYNALEGPFKFETILEAAKETLAILNFYCSSNDLSETSLEKMLVEFRNLEASLAESEASLAASETQEIY